MKAIVKLSRYMYLTYTVSVYKSGHFLPVWKNKLLGIDHHAAVQTIPIGELPAILD